MTKAVELAQVASTGVSEAFKNRIINGAMVIDQRNAGASVTPTNAQYLVDRWYANQTTASKFSAQQNAGSVTPPAGFINYLGTTSLSAYTPSSGDVFAVAQSIEGLNVADLNWGTANAQTVTLSFWVRSSLTGTFGGCVNNSAQNRSYPFTYTISSANTWEQKSITVPGDTTGTWLTNNGVGIRIYFSLGAGSTYLGPAGSWASATYTSATGSTNVVGTNGATFYITGVQLEVGSSATNFEYRPYGTELQLCQRYYAKMLATGGTYAAFGSGAWISSTSINGFLKYPVTMRSSPTISYGGTLAISYGAGVLTNVTSVGSTYAGTDSTLWQPTTASVGTAAQPAVIMASNDATTFVAFSSEL